MYLTEIELQIYKKEIFGFDAIKSGIHVLLIQRGKRDRSADAFGL